MQVLYVADDDNIPRRMHNANREVDKLWSSSHCHWVPSGPGLSLKIMKTHAKKEKLEEKLISKQRYR